MKIQSFFGQDVKSLIPQIAALRIEIFKDPPFLYEGDLNYEKKYLEKFTYAQDAIVVVAFDGDEVIGVSTGLPLIFESEDVKKPFSHPEEYFYFGESILKNKYRGLGIGRRFFDEREKHVKDLGKFKYICFCTIKTEEKRHLEDFWAKRGYTKHPELTCFISWKQIGETEETPKEMVFWIKKL